MAASVAVETLKIYEERDILGHVRSISPGFQARLQELGRHELVGQARGTGLIGTLELVKNKSTRENFEPSEGVALYAGNRAQAHGVITRGMGDNLNLCPPLIITQEQIDDLIDRVKLALDDTLDWLSTRRNPG